MRFIFFALLTVALQANARTIVELSDAQFKPLASNPAQMDPAKLYYTGKVLTYQQWNQQYPDEAKALNLYNGFAEPQVISLKYGIEKRVTEKMMVFVAQGKMLINKVPAQISLSNFTKIDFIRKFDPDLKSMQINATQVIPAELQQLGATPLDKRPQLPNFQWCTIPQAADDKTPPTQVILRPQRERDLTYLIPQGRPMWCSDTARTICVESCYMFNKGYRALVATANAVLAKDEQKDKGIAFQSEIRPFASEQEAAIPVPLQRLTGLASPVRGGLEQNSFYFNQIFQYAKILGVIQEMPGHPNQSVATIYFAVGIKKRTWDINSQVSQVLMGESKGYLNTETGITAGLPAFTQTTLDSIGQILEN